MTPEFATAFRNMMCDDILLEAKTTRRVIEAVPQERSDYRPDEKSKTAFELAWHIASSSVDMLEGIADAKFGTELRYTCPATTAEIGAWYEGAISAAVERVRGLSAEQLLARIDFYGMFNFPAFIYLTFVGKHEIHHRGQLAAYLRPMGSKVPNIYGGSADEPFELTAGA